jgi:signal transduction histidine kinase
VKWPLSFSFFLAAFGIVLTVASGIIEVADAEPSAQMWVGAAAGAAFLLAVLLVRGGDEAQVLTRRARLLVGAGTAAVLAVIGLWQVTERAEPRVLLLLVPALLLFLTASLAVREAARTGHAVRAGQLRSRLDGEEAERRRWARELHDQTLQDLAAIEVRLGSLAGESDPAAIGAALQDTRTMVHEQIRTLRHLIAQMRPLALDTLGLAAALQDLAQRAEDTGDVPVHCELADLPGDLGPEAQVSIYRIVQEAVTNALSHAACHEIAISTRIRRNRLEVRVGDDGIGLDAQGRPAVPALEGFGLIGMAERAAAINARLTWSTPLAGGTLVTLSLDL